MHGSAPAEGDRWADCLAGGWYAQFSPSLLLTVLAGLIAQDRVDEEPVAGDGQDFW